MITLRAWLEGIQRHWRHWLPELITLLTLAVLLIAAFQFSGLDLWIQSHFYDPERGGWYMKQLPWIRVVNNYHAKYLTILMALGFFVCIVLGSFKRVMAIPRNYCIYALVALVMGPGLVVNVMLKPHWGRPRPRQVTEFNGNREYRQALTVTSPRRGRSFPSGHAAAGFFSFFLFHVFRNRRILGSLGLLFGLINGGLAGFARMVYGGHFLSDVLWAGIIVFAINGFLYYGIWNFPEKRRHPELLSAVRRPLWIPWLLFTILVIGAAAATPIYHDHKRLVGLHDEQSRPMTGLKLELEVADLRIIREPRHDVSVAYTASGFGFHGSSMERRIRTEDIDGQPWIYMYTRLKGWMSEFNADIEIRVPAREDFALDIRIGRGSLIIESSQPPPASFQVELKKGELELPGNWAEHDVPRNM